MKKTALVLASAAIITVASIGGYAFAQGNNEVEPKNDQPKVAVEESAPIRNNNNHCGNNEEMIQIMKDNGFEGMVQWMEEGDFEAMEEFMNNMSEEDYEKMVSLMNESGYGNMSRMMKFIGREGMIDMHSSMMGGNGNGFDRGRNMMGRFK